jgi:predicted PolB exonuclease-like 3'-5' exonuclease
MLKSDINELVWFFDLEWVPDAAGAMRLYDLAPETSEIDAMEAIWRNTAGYSEENARPFVKYLLSRIVSIAFLSRRLVYQDGEPVIEFALHSLPKLPLDETTSDEAYIINQFLYYVGVRNPQLVGFNSHESDLQVLIQRGLINEVRGEAFCERPPKPWEGRDYFDSRNSEAHFDILQRLSRGAMRPQLNELARLCGFPGKIDVDGEQVVDLWLAGRLREIVEYNQIDTINTYLVWLRIVNFCGKISEDDYQNEHLAFREFLETEAEKPDKEFLKKFLAKWDH